MPGGDGTGPFGIFRNCAPVGAQGNPQYAPFYGRKFFARGGFGGRGLRRRFLATGIPGWQAYQKMPAAQQTKEEEIKQLEQEIKTIKERLEELKKEV